MTSARAPGARRLRRGWTTALRRVPDRVATAVTVAALVGMNLTRHLLSPPWWVGPVEAGALLLFARCAGLDRAQLGLSRGRLRAGGRWALGAVAVVAVVYGAAVLLPLTRPAFLDARYHLPPGPALVTALVVIPLGTVLPEEIAFRSVLWGMLARHARPWQVLVTTSVCFGLWHVLPALGLDPGGSGALGGGGAARVVAATVAVTTLGGLVFGELRRRSGSVLAPAGAHWATNGLGVLFGLAAWHLTG